jgi:hypothetical protein
MTITRSGISSLGVDVLLGPLLALARQELRLIQVAVKIHVQQIEGVGDRW